MTRSFLTKSARSESYDAGCLSGFMSTFGFHIGQYPQKYLSHRKYGDCRALAECSRGKLDFSSTMEIKHKDIDDGENKASRDNSRMESVKGHMQEERSKTHGTKIQNNELGRSQSMSELESRPKEKNKKKSKDRNVISNHHVTDLSYSSLDFGDLASPSEISSLAYDLASFMVQLYFANQQCKVQDDSDTASYSSSMSNAHRKKFHLDKMDSQLSEEHFTLYKAMADVAKVFLSQKVVDSNVHVNQVGFQTSEFTDALEILSSNMDLLVKFIQDRNFPPLKNIQEIQHTLTMTENLEEPSASKQFEASLSDETFQKKSHHKFFRKKDKLKEHYSLHDMSKIVVLKPTTVRTQKHSVRHTLSSSAHSHHRLRHQEKCESTKSYFSLKGIKRRLSHVIGENRKGKHPISMDSMLDRIPYGFKDSGDAQKNSVLAGNTSCNSQLISHPSKIGKKGEKSKLKTANPLHRESSFYEETLQHLIEILAANNDGDCSSTVSKSPRAVASLPEYNSQSPRFNPQSDDDDIMYSPGKILLSPSRHLECAAEHLMMKGGATCEGREEEKSCVFSELEAPDDRMKLVIPSLCSSPTFLHTDKVENPDETLKNPERPSPVSVLERFLLEEITSPGSTTSDHVDLPLQPQQVDFEDRDASAVAPTTLDFGEKEEMYGFVRTILQESGVSCYGVLERWKPSDQFLQPSLFEEVEFSNGRLHVESKLVYDCIIEVLVETQERSFNCTPWASLREVNFIEDVCKAIGRKFQPSQLNSEVFEGRSWMDLRFEIGGIVNEIADGVLEEVMQETISK